MKNNKKQGPDLRLTKSQYAKIHAVAAREKLSVAEVVHKAIQEAHPLIKLIADSGSALGEKTGKWPEKER